MPHRLKSLACLLPAMVVAPLLAAPATLDDDGPQHNFRAHLSGPGEVPLTLTAATGNLQLTVNHDDTLIHFVLTYQGLETHIRFSHIHIGKPTDTGGVTIFFCGGGPTGHVRPACPEVSGTVEGDVTADDVIGLPAQELATNDLGRVLRAIRSGQTYANLHTDATPGGEIRGQIHGSDDDR